MQDLSGKVILVTGSTDGLGKLVARHAAGLGGTILLHGRNRRKGDDVVSEIQREAKTETVEYYNADLSSLDEVNTMADEILKKHKSLHVLINNAGIGGGPRGNRMRELSRDGHEMRFAVNYLSHFLLTRRLLPIIKAGAPSRIVNVSSIGQHPIDFGDVMLEKHYESFRAYRQSKLAQIMFTIDLANELKKSGVIANCLHPATLMNTNMVYEFFGSMASTVEDGAEALEYVAFSDDTANVSGVYFDGKKKSKANDQAYDPQARRQLRELSLELTGLPRPTFQ
jgi:NAD(P)-dependent dehydrogenase (short-subunit alcohol dehydrogenase family)